eukprot:scaffold669997_cov50-Prasinocladus_malaysianus.AAC.1
MQRREWRMQVHADLLCHSHWPWALQTPSLQCRQGAPLTTTLAHCNFGKFMDRALPSMPNRYTPEAISTMLTSLLNPSREIVLNR